jgi:hypothetical protein
MAMATIFISKVSIFLPRYSGVRPIISPAMNTARMAKTSMPYRPEPTPPNTTSPSCISTRARRPQRGEGIVHGVDRAAGGRGGDGGEQRGGVDAEAHLLAFHVAAFCSALAGSVPSALSSGLPAARPRWPARP